MLSKEKEALEAGVNRLEQLRDILDRQVAELRASQAAAEDRVQAAHRLGLDAAGEAKRLVPYEVRAVQLDAALHAAQAEVERVQRAVTAHQATIKQLLDDKAQALKELAARSQALEVVQGQVRELTAASRDRGLLAGDKAKLEEEVKALRERCTAQEALQADAMHQLAVAKQLLTGVHAVEERERLARAEANERRFQQAAMAKTREAELLQARLDSMEQQLAYAEQQLQVLVHSMGAAPGVSSASSSGRSGSGGGGQPLSAQAAVHDQLRRLLELKEDRIRHLDRLHTSLVTSTAQLKQLQGQVAARDTIIAELHAQVETVRKKLHMVQVGAVGQAPASPPLSLIAWSCLGGIAFRRECDARHDGMGPASLVCHGSHHHNNTLCCAVLHPFRWAAHSNNNHCTHSVSMLCHSCPQETQMRAATQDMVALASSVGMPAEVVQSLLREHLRRHLRSELVWTKAKLGFVGHLARNLRVKLRAEQAARAQVDLPFLDCVCMQAAARAAALGLRVASMSH